MLIGDEFIKGHYEFKPEESTDFIRVQIGWDIVILVVVGAALFLLIRYIRKRLSK
jgi:hypothetical protein